MSTPEIRPALPLPSPAELAAAQRVGWVTAAQAQAISRGPSISATLPAGTAPAAKPAPFVPHPGDGAPGIVPTIG